MQTYLPFWIATQYISYTHSPLPIIVILYYTLHAVESNTVGELHPRRRQFRRIRRLCARGKSSPFSLFNIHCIRKELYYIRSLIIYPFTRASCTLLRLGFWAHPRQKKLGKIKNGKQEGSMTQVRSVRDSFFMHSNIIINEYWKWTRLV